MLRELWVSVETTGAYVENPYDPHTYNQRPPGPTAASTPSLHTSDKWGNARVCTCAWICMLPGRPEVRLLRLCPKHQPRHVRHPLAPYLNGGTRNAQGQNDEQSNG
ncbi:hypothetical protein NDU88_008408 [Pleurodeles waltl]|uniref:Uncharacterized protein n=1 Tax=Pleurodeles waltl TaxID=8319 RepID=A0AAV7NZ57_PLEWA|nr:hypothetical protein NDU88_008391 [Pleurodeles waltl]KAJ1120234.1 hypothetical protein NDU88_008408 [Pleurodeles waltl]